MKPPNLASFHQSLQALKERVGQIVQYHRIRPSAAPQDAVIAHYTRWSSCQEMLAQARKRSEAQGRKKKDARGISLWAGDANCLNDPLEGQALMKFAEDASKGIVTSTTYAAASHILGGAPHLASFVAGQYPPLTMSASTWPQSEWKEVNKLIHDLYDIPPQSVTGWSQPRALLWSEVYLVSFNVEDDRLDLWRAYGDEAQGACLVMPLRAAARLVERTPWGFYKVLYDDGSKMRAWLLLWEPLRNAWKACKKLPEFERPIATKRILNTISPVMHLYKHQQYQTENEIRLMYSGRRAKLRTEPIRGEHRPVLETEPFFLRAPGAKVILGSKAPERNRRMAALKIQLKAAYRSDVPVVQLSGVPYQ